MPTHCLLTHAPGAPGLRLLGLGPYLIPRHGLRKLQLLLEKYTFWANQRSLATLRIMLKNSSVIISLWEGKELIGFGRATSDGVFRTVIWDVVVADQLQGNGYGKLIINELLKSPAIKNTEKIYLMTTNSTDFYEQVGFKLNTKQDLMYIDKS